MLSFQNAEIMKTYVYEGEPLLCFSMCVCVCVCNFSGEYSFKHNIYYSKLHFESRQTFLGMNLILRSLDYVFFSLNNLESQRKTPHNLVCYVNKQQSRRGYEHRSPGELDSYKAFGRKCSSILGSHCFHIYWILDIPKSSKRDQIIFDIPQWTR